jgi:hypothetical protein
MNMEQAIASLGDTVDGVSDTLRRAGIKGERNGGMTCPIAKYLHSLYPVFLKVCAPCVLVYGPQLGTFEFPNHVQAWIRRFDAGKYPEFVEVW